jgi:hypothetical protein
MQFEPRPFEMQDASRSETALVTHVVITDEAVRCRNPQCRKLLGDVVSRPYSFTCPRCKQVTPSPPS